MNDRYLLLRNKDNHMSKLIDTHAIEWVLESNPRSGQGVLLQLNGHEGREIPQTYDEIVQHLGTDFREFTYQVAMNNDDLSDAVYIRTLVSVEYIDYVEETAESDPHTVIWMNSGDMVRVYESFAEVISMLTEG